MDFCFLYVHTHTLSDTSETVLNVSYMAQAYCFTQRGLSPTEDMAASSPTAPVPKHGKVGVKESETQKHREQDGKWKREEREREWEREGRWRGREGVTTARGAVSPFSVLPPQTTEQVHLWWLQLPFISFTKLDLLFSLIRSSDTWILWIYLSSNIVMEDEGVAKCKQWTTDLLPCKINGNCTSPQQILTSYQSFTTPNIAFMLWITIATQRTQK